MDAAIILGFITVIVLLVFIPILQWWEEQL